MTSPVAVKCRSGDDDLGYVIVRPFSDCHFEFNQNFFGTTLFLCKFEWGTRHKEVCGRVTLTMNNYSALLMARMFGKSPLEVTIGPMKLMKIPSVGPSAGVGLLSSRLFASMMRYFLSNPIVLYSSLIIKSNMDIFCRA